MEFFYSLTPEISAAEDLADRVLLYIKIRLYIILVLGVAGALATLAGGGFSLTKLLILIAIGLAFNYIFYLLAKVGKSREFSIKFFIYFAMIQIFFDVCLFSASIYLDRGEISRALIMYSFPILISSALFARSLIYFTAFLSGFAYFWVVFIRIVQDTGNLPRPDQIVFGLLYSSIFVLLGYLANYLYSLRRSEEVRLAQTEMVSLASHQLRTPATAVKGYLSFLVEGTAGKLNPKQFQFAKEAFNENNVQLKLIDNILNVARIDLKSLNFNPSTTDISTLIEDVMHEHLNLINQRRQVISFKVHTQDARCFIDPQLLRIAIDNLISNASKFSGRDGKITIKLFGDEKNIRLSVEDNGPGISSLDQRKLFKRFSRVFKAHQAEGAEGSGLGLYMTKELVRLHGGSIDVVSYPNEGSIFTITLPRKEK